MTKELPESLSVPFLSAYEHIIGKDFGELPEYKKSCSKITSQAAETLGEVFTQRLLDNLIHVLKSIYLTHTNSIFMRFPDSAGRPDFSLHKSPPVLTPEEAAETIRLTMSEGAGPLTFEKTHFSSTKRHYLEILDLINIPVLNIFMASASLCHEASDTLYLSIETKSQINTLKKPSFFQKLLRTIPSQHYDGLMTVHNIAISATYDRYCDERQLWHTNSETASSVMDMTDPDISHYLEETLSEIILKEQAITPEIFHTDGDQNPFLRTTTVFLSEIATGIAKHLKPGQI